MDESDHISISVSIYLRFWRFNIVEASKEPSREKDDYDGGGVASPMVLLIRC